MLKHHEESIRNVVDYFKQEAEVEALLLGGSIAHGFALPTSDVDVMILVSEQAYAERLKRGDLHFFNRELCTYADGYVDGKYLNPGFLLQVAEKGSEPARFAFKDAQVLFSRDVPVEPVLESITRYPVEGKEQRLQRFYAQFEAWHWYVTEALKLENRYLLGVSVGKMVLFASRLILAHNELLYPYHKWMLRVLAEAKDRPPALLESIERLYDDTSAENTQQFYESVRDFREWDTSGVGWPVRFMEDTELTWQTGTIYIDDL